MEIKKLLVVGIGISLSSLASADYVQMHLVEFEVDTWAPGTTTWRLYAEFDGANDQLNMVGGSPKNLGAIKRFTSFYQSPYGGYLSNQINMIWGCIEVPICSDSWVTIGYEDMTENTLTSVGLEPDAFESEGANFIIVDGSWSVPQDDQYAFGIELVGMENFHVLVGQFSIYGFGEVSMPWGQLNLSGINSNGTPWLVNGATFGVEYSVCPDITGDSFVNVSDLLAVIDAWGQTKSTADVTADGVVDVSDLLMVVSSWGPCG